MDFLATFFLGGGAGWGGVSKSPTRTEPKYQTRVTKYPLNTDHDDVGAVTGGEAWETDK